MIKDHRRSNANAPMPLRQAPFTFGGNMTIPEIIRAMRYSVRPVKYGEDIVSAIMPVPADIMLWAIRVDEAYRRLVSEFAKLSHGLDWHTPTNCDGCTPSEEYLKEYAESTDNKYPPEEGKDDWLEDAKYDMEYCHQCGNTDCEYVKMRELVKRLREEINAYNAHS